MSLKKMEQGIRDWLEDGPLTLEDLTDLVYSCDFGEFADELKPALDNLVERKEITLKDGNYSLRSGN
jgi:hypothetical protein